MGSAGCRLLAVVNDRVGCIDVQHVDVDVVEIGGYLPGRQVLSLMKLFLSMQTYYLSSFRYKYHSFKLMKKFLVLRNQ